MGRRRGFWSGRRRRASGGDAQLGIVVLGAVAVAVLGVYLVLVGVLGLVGWLVVFVARSPASTSSAPVVIETSRTTPSIAVVAEDNYRVVLPVDAAVFGNSDAMRIAAGDVFTAWARQLPKAPSDPRVTLRGFALRQRLIGRLTTKLDGRRFVWTSGPHRGRNKPTSHAPIDPSQLDPYNPPGDLRARSSYLVLCDACGGPGHVECGACRGAGRVRRSSVVSARRARSTV